MELADSLEEVKTTCNFCNKKAVLNLKHVNGVADTSGPAVQLGSEEKYFPACFTCYRSNVNEASQSPSLEWVDKFQIHIEGADESISDEDVDVTTIIE